MSRARSRNAGERIARWIRHELARHPPKAKSLVVTVWGDAIAPHGGAVWLGGLIRLLAPLGLNERLVRTSVYRLAREGWLGARQIGRRSLYRLTTAGLQRFEHAYRRIYAARAAGWDGTWEIVACVAALSSRQRRELKRELGWEGFASIGAGLYARPGPRKTDLRPLLATLGIVRGVLVLRARDVAGPAAGSLAARTRESWDRRRVAAEYRAFLRRFGPVVEDFRAAGAVDPEQAFVVRSLLIHAFRRVTLHDPGLPDELAPPGWPARDAYALCRELYRLTRGAAERYLATTLRAPDGGLPAAASFGRRFRES
ncbi:MAG TPA: phenylacetic acid degradation operon negative regulatory protein PaaX [Casimicrobiaceae bacterium]|nr:phenylacetic acid degradation operon negative regulatory protein PaaX [Casimicrobiaceae bacterium]